MRKNMGAIVSKETLIHQTATPFAGELEKEIETSAEFARVLEKIKDMEESEADRRSRLSAETEAAAQKKRRNSRILELRGRIAQLKTKLASSQHPKRLMAELSGLQHELFWLLMDM